MAQPVSAAASDNAISRDDVSVMPHLTTSMTTTYCEHKNRVIHQTGSVIETHEHAGDFKRHVAHLPPHRIFCFLEWISAININQPKCTRTNHPKLPLPREAED